MYAIDFKELSGTPRLFLDFLNCREPACRYFRYDFGKTDSYRRAAEIIDEKTYNREKLASIITEAVSDIGLSQETRVNIEKLKRPDSLCVFGGQQVGILLGPMYSVLKAITAYKLARKLEQDLGRPVVPCFWLASDDHDFEEVKSVRVLDRDGGCKTITYQPAEILTGAPVADVKLGLDANDFLEQVEQNLVLTEFSDEIKDMIRDAYRPGRAFPKAFVALFERVLQTFGIIPVDPNFPGMKKLFTPVFEREIENHAPIFELFENRSRQLISDGYHRQVHKTAESLNLFYSNGVRRNIKTGGGKFMFDGHEESFSKDRMLDLLYKSPESFSGNVTLRPITQCFAFPTVSQIVGPSEAAYFAQIGPLYDYHGVPWPVIHPRLFATLVEPHIKKIMSKLSIDFAGLVNDTEFEISRAIRGNFPPQVQNRADELRLAIEKPLLDLAEPLKGTDLESYQAIDHARRRIDHELNHLSRKLFMAHKKKHDEARKRVYKVAAFLLPNGNFQERVISPIYFINKFGVDIFRRVEAELDLNSVAHQMVNV